MYLNYNIVLIQQYLMNVKREYLLINVPNEVSCILEYHSILIIIMS